MGPLVSLIVTTKNSQRTLRACLASARRQRYEPIEIVVVDNASTDGTVQIARQFADVIVDMGPERSAQRNAGIKAAHGEYILVLDADMVLDDNVVGAALEASEGGERAVVLPEESFGEGFWSACKAFERSFYSRDALVTAARFFSRACVLDAGGFDESLTGPEDWDLSMRLSGSAPVAFAAARILHDEGRQSLGALYGKKYYYGRSIPAFVHKHGADALRRMSPLRPSLVRGLGRMLLHPVLTGGLLIMKSAEFLGILAGTLDPRPRRSETLYRSTGS